MFTNQEMHAINDDLFSRMLVAGWLKNYTFTQGKGWHLQWTETGALAALELKKMRHDLALGGGDERPVIASILAHGQSPDIRSLAKTVNDALRPFLTSGLASRALFVHMKYCEVQWTKDGERFCARLVEMLAALKIEMGDQDRLIALFTAADGRAPDGETKFVVG